MSASIEKKLFRDINIEDNFFDSLRKDYEGFDSWFRKKNNEEAYVLEENGKILAFLYMKIEDEVNDVHPEILFKDKILKVGTFKVQAHGTILGERFIKLIFDEMIKRKIKQSYVTIYEKQNTLIQLLEKFGFVYHGKKGNESVYVKDFTKIVGDIEKDYPLIRLDNNKKFILSIYPEYHTQLFPDSKLHTERDHIVEDFSYTNSIEKIYLSGAQDIEFYRKGDIAVIYRTAELGFSAEYRSVLTSVCTISSIININSFRTEKEFLEFCSKRTIFSETRLKSFWYTKKYPYIVTMLYNFALNKRIIRKEMIEKIGVNRLSRILAYKISDGQMKEILCEGRDDIEFITY